MFHPHLRRYTSSFQRARNFRCSKVAQSIILFCARWYLAYSLSLCNLKAMMAEHGIAMGHSTVHRWVLHFSRKRRERLNRRKR